LTGSNTGAAERADEHADAVTAMTANIRKKGREKRTAPLLWQFSVKRWHWSPSSRGNPQNGGVSHDAESRVRFGSVVVPCRAGVRVLIVGGC
jgi:hypothetical protein